ncbi:WAT1-related protein At1g68170 [Ziziphus jujuba]|uniref:WAT1-related protein n=2 Tax=Ziziphus jujuba TaxID=326968 RepID=A0A6P4A0B6_ZIZJJ|nr:WAT1-related protein At1g68170 [Ziziphus jujuba]KAH7520757.1 hypothetical protein FEM48_Zijuj08G0179300 [Ziziphus jujuba var. spinosa]
MGVKMYGFINELKPVLLMVVAQALYAGLNVLYKLVLYDGMSVNILIAYRFIFASAFMVPLAFFVERKKRPKLTWMTGFQGFLCGIFGGSLGQSIFAESLALTSATFASSMSNLIPALSFIMGAIFGLEMFGIRTLAGKAKVVGVVVSFSGAMIFILCKGPEIKMWSTGINLLQNYDTTVHHRNTNYALGSFLSISNCLSTTIWLLIQAKMGEKYPPYSVTALMCVSASIQATIYAVFVERDWSKWKLGWNIRLLTAIYVGMFPSGVCVTIITWCSAKKGVLFASAFYPLGLVFVAIAGTFFLDEHLNLGSLMGAILIVSGLYCVLWGKNKELKLTSKMPCSKGSRDSAPISSTEATSIKSVQDEVQTPSVIVSIEPVRVNGSKQDI